MISRKRMLVLVLVVLVFLRLSKSGCYTSISGLDHNVYQKLGDINIGFTTGVYEYSPTEFCGRSYSKVGAQSTELPAFITEQINKDDDLLPNITLGFVTLDDCHKEQTALARSMSFVPASDHNYPVIGVVGPSSSEQSVFTASLLGLFRIPVLSPHSTSDELSDKRRFPYFMRLMSPDAVHVTAVVDIVLHFGWTYVSLVHSEGSRGQDAVINLERVARRRNVCLAAIEMIPSDATYADYESVLAGLQSEPRARVVILFLRSSDLSKLFALIKRKQLASRFIWISDDNMASIEHEHDDNVLDGALYVGFPNRQMPDFEEYMRSLSWRNSTNPWLPLVFESLYNCTWSENDELGMPSCQSYDTLANVTHDHWSAPVNQADAFIVYAKALHSLIENRCPEMFRDDALRQKLGDCIDGALLLEYMKNTSFPGYCGYVRFDENGDLRMNYVVIQIQSDLETGQRIVGRWDSGTNALRINNSALDWGRQKWNVMAELWSACSGSCGVGQIRQRNSRVPCCWECVACRENEVTTRNGTECELCANYTWPDENTRTTCRPIEPYYLEANSVTGLCIIALSATGVLLSLAFITVYAAKKDDRLLKASSRRLSVLTLFGCMLNSVLAASFMSYPDVWECRIRLAGFHLGVCIMYSPLVAKTSRLYRIFKSGNQRSAPPRFISNTAQLALTAAIILTQVVLLAVLEAHYPNKPTLSMPVAHERYVEVTCSVSLESFVPPLVFNLILIFVCAVLGYITKGLPENFNESRYIVMSVATTLFLWVVFLPTYFSAVQAYRRTVYISACLLLNSYITMLGQFGPKVYAVFFLVDHQPGLHCNTIQATSASPAPRTSSD